MNKEEIKTKLDELEKVKIQLKQKFVGINKIIDSFIDNIKIWYVAPELQMRPLIINLWGMTGVGKTDLIRTFVKLVKFNDKFIEIQMDNLSKNYGQENCIQYHLESVLEDSDIQGILLLDEIQRFKTINEQGADLPKEETDKFADIWTLLSDGKFSNDSSNKRNLLDLFYELIYEIEVEKNNIDNNNSKSNEKSNEIKKELKYKTYYWRAKRIKSLLKIDESVEKIMLWDSDLILNKIVDALKSSIIFEGTSYSKLLIVISGNLDEAYHMSNDSDESDIDADIYHEYSNKITMLDIKKALSKRFKPEQIARFGNTHLIYPSLNKDSYMKIIKMKCNEISNKLKEKSDINISFDNSVYDVIYRNGVFPTQGVRPLLSTISSIIENSLPHFLYNCLLKNIDEINISFENSFLYTNIQDDKIEYKINTVIDDIKKKKNINSESLIAVHEVGHSIAYMELFRLIPLQLICNTASSDSGGFIINHMTGINSKDIIKNKIILSLSGQVAEEIIFGENKKSEGSSEDIKQATTLASYYVRIYGMDGFVGNIIVAPAETREYGIIEKNESNESIKTLLNECKIESRNIITSKLSLLKKLSLKLLEQKIIKNETIFNIAKDYYKDIKIEDTSYLINEKYNELMIRKFDEIK